MRVVGGVLAAAVVIGLAPIALLLTILALGAVVFGPEKNLCVGSVPGSGWWRARGWWRA